MLAQVQPEDLVEFGMIPEFVGRLLDVMMKHPKLLERTGKCLTSSTASSNTSLFVIQLPVRRRRAATPVAAPA